MRWVHFNPVRLRPLRSTSTLSVSIPYRPRASLTRSRTRRSLASFHVHQSLVTSATFKKQTNLAAGGTPTRRSLLHHRARGPPNRAGSRRRDCVWGLRPPVCFCVFEPMFRKETSHDTPGKTAWAG